MVAAVVEEEEVHRQTSFLPRQTVEEVVRHTTFAVAGRRRALTREEVRYHRHTVPSSLN
jgi:cytochrome P450